MRQCEDSNADGNTKPGQFRDRGIVCAMKWKAGVLAVALVVGACSFSTDPEAGVLTAIGPEPETVFNRADLEEGTDYRYRFQIHCGTEWLGEFNGLVWRTEDLIYDGIGRTPDHLRQFFVDPQNTISPELWTFITLTSSDEITLRLPDGSETAIYRPTTDERPGCA